MKSVLISIKPKDCKLIADGKMTIKVLKSRPKIETPFKVYIYCTKHKPYLYRVDDDDNFELTNALRSEVDVYVKDYNKQNGKVIGEFICDKVEKLEEHIEEGGIYYTLNSDFNEAAQLDNWQLHDYGKGKDIFGWHISDLKIYDKPKELNQFSIPCKVSCENCKNPLYFQSLCKEKGKKILTHPPHSWCYISED